MNLILRIPLEVHFLTLFVLGACVGSLANWGIYRLAWHRRAISPWSRPDAGALPRRPWDRIPILGWLGLRRESVLHGRGFWIRPMLLELCLGAGFAALYGWEVVGLGLLGPDFPHHLDSAIPPILLHEYIAHVLLISLMFVATWIDIDEKTIPDAVTVPGALLGLMIVAVWPASLLPDVTVMPNGVHLVNFTWLSSPNESEPWRDLRWTGWQSLGLGLGCFLFWCVALLPRSWYARHGYRRALQLLIGRLVRDWTTYAILAMSLVGSAGIVAIWYRSGLRWTGLLSALTGMATAAALIWIVRVLGAAVLRREAMGFGDVTLMAMIGAFLGWQAAVIIFFLAPFAGLVIGLGQWLLHGESEIPYGPFLCLATVVTIVGWASIWGMVQNTFALGWLLLLILAVCLSMMVVLLPLVRWVMRLVR